MRDIRDATRARRPSGRRGSTPLGASQGKAAMQPAADQQGATQALARRTPALRSPFAGTPRLGPVGVSWLPATASRKARSRSTSGPLRRSSRLAASAIAESMWARPRTATASCIGAGLAARRASRRSSECWVADLLAKCYATCVTPTSGDGEVDVIAHEDREGLGPHHQLEAQSPRRRGPPGG